MKKQFYTWVTAGALALVTSASAQTVSDFENLPFISGKYWNGSGPSVSKIFNSGKANFPNVYQTAFGGYWSNGWAISKKADTTTVGVQSLYASRAGKGAVGSANYAVGQQGSIVRMAGNAQNDTVRGLYISNSTYAALSMKNGDAFAKKFGGTSGNDPDFFKLLIKGYRAGSLTADSVEFYLADYRYANNSLDYIVTGWKYVDLSKLGKVDSLVFNLKSSDVGQFGINTPTFFCIDNLICRTDSGAVVSTATADFENIAITNTSKYINKNNTTLQGNFSNGNAFFPNVYSVSDYGDYWSSGWAYSKNIDTTTAGYTNIYSATAGKGYNASTVYAVGQQNSYLHLTGAAINKAVKGFYVTNGTYPYLSMKNGDAFAKKFGGASGNDPDYFKLTTYKIQKGKRTDSVGFYLADFRNADNTKDYIVNKWQWVDLTKLGNVDTLAFVLSSSDVGQFGMNTPAFFCMDNFTTLDSPTGIFSETIAGEGMRLYPNPAKDMLFVNFAENLTGKELLEVYNMNGQLVLQTPASLTMTVDVDLLPAGIYILRLTNNAAYVKFVKE